MSLLVVRLTAQLSVLLGVWLVRAGVVGGGGVEVLHLLVLPGLLGRVLLGELHLHHWLRGVVLRPGRVVHRAGPRLAAPALVAALLLGRGRLVGRGGVVGRGRIVYLVPPHTPSNSLPAVAGRRYALLGNGLQCDAIINHWPLLTVDSSFKQCLDR